jgi:S-DNA-T family DNA segregation ATPase FtsK/SpoIIIE
MPRKKKKKLEKEKVQRDFTVDPETQREILSIFLLVSGVLLLLASLNLAGNLGEALLGILRYLFGFLGFFVSIAFIIIGGGLLLKRISFKVSKTAGLILSFITIPTLFHPYSGAIGALVGVPLHEAVGGIAAVLIALALSAITLLLATDTSIVKLLKLERGEEEEGGEDDESIGVKVNNPSVPVMTLGSVAKGGFRLPFGKKNAAASPPAPAPAKVVPISTVKTRDKNWTLPSLDLLEVSTTRADPGNVKKNVTSIEKTLKDFGISVAMGEVNVGPTVTQYTLKPAEGVKLNQITARSNDLALALAAHPIRVEAPIPGKAAVGVEIPNKEKAIVSLKEILASDKFKSDKSNLVLAMGRDVAGEPVTIDLTKAPHMLIAGATGSGKSVGINAVLLSLLYQNAPADLRLLLVDPKRVEFSMYNDIPHLLSPVITESDKTVSALKWAVAEMERRYKVFESQHKRNLAEYNAANPEEHIPYVVVVIDELADLMAQAANEVEGAIVRLAQMARAVGIHLIVATQRPSVDVITGLIKANITTRIAFAVASQIDSRTILDQAGAERLLGNGDMLYLGAESPQPRRIQGVYVSSKEVDAVTKFLRDAGPAEYDEQVLLQKSSAGRGGSNGGGGDIDDPSYEEAKELVIQSGKASASLLQRRMRVGYARAARLLDILEDQGVIGPADGAKPREVLQDSYSFNEQPSAAEPVVMDKSDPDQYQ